MTAEAPWNLAKMIHDPKKYPNTASVKAQLDAIIYYIAEALRIVGILLQPYMPGKSSELREILGVDETKRTFSYARVGLDYTYGAPKRSVGTTAWDGLFPPLAVEK